MAHGYFVEAEYESGYIHRETPEDLSPYVKGMNIFNDIVQRRPESAHGRIVRFSLVGPKTTTNVDFTVLPANARPIYFREMEQDSIGGEIIETRVMKQVVGYQYTDADGKNQKLTQDVYPD